LCDAIKTVANQLGRGETPSSDELVHEQAARLRLENARALLTFGLGIRPSPRSQTLRPRNVRSAAREHR
jgi:hypothetical protein